MSLVKKNETGEDVYYQLVESCLEKGRTRQRVLADLDGYPTVDAALEDLPRHIAELRRDALECRDEARRIHQHLSTPEGGGLEGFGGEVPRSRVVSSRLRWFINRCDKYWQHIDSASSRELRAGMLEARLAGLRKLREKGKA